MMWHETGYGAEHALTECDLKICDLCGALNLADNRECFVCGWHGRFERRAEILQIAMDLLKRRHGELKLEFLTGSGTCRQAAARHLRARIASGFARMRYWLLG